MRLGNRGQQIGEYVVMVGVVAAAMVSTQMLLSRRVADKLVKTGHAVLGTATPVDDANNTSTSTSTDTVRQRGSPNNIRTTVFPRDHGQSHSGFVLAEAPGPYVFKTITFKDSQSTMELMSQLAGEEVLDVVGEPQDLGNGLVAVRVRTRSGVRVLKYQVRGLGFFKKQEMWVAVLDAEIELATDADGDGQRDVLRKSFYALGTLGEAFEKGGLRAFTKEFLTAEEGADAAWNQLDTLQKELEAIKKDPTYPSPLNRLDEKQRDALLQKVLEAKAKLRQIASLNDPWFDTRTSVSEVAPTPRRWDPVELEAALLSLDNDQVDKLRESLRKVDQLRSDIGEAATPSATLNMTMPSGETIEVVLDDDDQDGSLDIVGVVLPNERDLRKAVKLSFDDDMEYEPIELMFTYVSDVTRDDVNDLNDQSQAVAGRLERALGDPQELKATFQAETRKFLEAEIQDPAIVDILIESVVTVDRYQHSPLEVSYEEYVEQFMAEARYERYGIKEPGRIRKLKAAFARMSDPNDSLHLAMDQAGFFGHDSAVELKTVIHDAGGEPLLIVMNQEAGGAYDRAQFKLPEDRKRAGHKLLWNEEVGLPSGIDENGDDRPEIKFAFGTGGQAGFDVAVRVDSRGRVRSVEPLTFQGATVEEPYSAHEDETGKRHDGVIVKPWQVKNSFTLGLNTDRTNSTPEGWLIGNQGSDGQYQLSVILDANHNSLPDDEDTLLQPPIEVANRPLSAPDREGSGQPSTTRVKDVLRALDYNARSREPIVPQGQFTDIDNVVDPDPLADYAVSTNWFQRMDWVLVEPDEFDAYLKDLGGQDVGLARAAEQLRRDFLEGGLTQPAPPVGTLKDDGLTAGTVAATGHHPYDFKDVDLVIQYNKEFLEATGGSARPPTQGQQLNLDQFLQNQP